MFRLPNKFPLRNFEVTFTYIIIKRKEREEMGEKKKKFTMISV